MSRSVKLGLVLLGLAVTSACTTLVVESPSAALGPPLSVERFLQAANQRDVEAMGRLFGTVDGSAMETGGTLGCAFKKMGSWFGGDACRSKQEVEIRMDAIASILEHDDYRIGREERVAGRMVPATRVFVDMTTAEGSAVSNVPFIVVKTDDGRWLIENVDLQTVMAAR
jgi:hypothetical protein